MNFIDLYCGAGFGARGAVAAGAHPVLAVDAWPKAAINYKANFPGTEVLSAKVEDLDPCRINRQFDVDILLASPECTSHSVARGSNPGCETSRETATNIIPWVFILRPSWVLIENVVRMRKWERHIELRESLEELGYQVSEIILNSADFGVPQSRRRLFLVCGLEKEPPNVKNFETVYSEAPTPVRDILDFSGRWRTSPLYSKNRAINTLERAERAIAEVGSREPFLIVYYGTDGSGGWQSLDVPLRTVTTLDRFALVTWEGGEYRMRMLQPPELILAMGAGRGHLLSFGNRRDRVKLCGNGVCSPVMEAIFNCIMENG